MASTKVSPVELAPAVSTEEASTRKPTPLISVPVASIAMFIVEAVPTFLLPIVIAVALAEKSASGSFFCITSAISARVITLEKSIPTKILATPFNTILTEPSVTAWKLLMLPLISVVTDLPAVALTELFSGTITKRPLPLKMLGDWLNTLLAM